MGALSVWDNDAARKTLNSSAPSKENVWRLPRKRNHTLHMICPAKPFQRTDEIQHPGSTRVDGCRPGLRGRQFGRSTAGNIAPDRICALIGHAPPHLAIQERSGPPAGFSGQFRWYVFRTPARAETSTADRGGHRFPAPRKSSRSRHGISS